MRQDSKEVGGAQRLTASEVKAWAGLWRATLAGASAQRLTASEVKASSYQSRWSPC